MNSVRLFAWDLSGVFTIEAPHSILDFAERCALPPARWLGVYRQYCDVERAWDRVERGECSLVDFANELAERIRDAGGTCSSQEATELWGAPDPFTAALGVRTNLFATVKQLRQSGYLTCLCTNNTKEWRSVWQGLLPVADLFDWVFNSSDMGLRKPEPDFFWHVQEITRCRDREILLIDDNEQNILQASAQFNWRTILFSGHVEPLLEELAVVAPIANARTGSPT